MKLNVANRLNREIQIVARKPTTYVYGIVALYKGIMKVWGF